MIHGRGVGAKYATIIDRAAEDMKAEDFITFKLRIQNSTLEEFEEWYQLYSSEVPRKKTARKEKNVSKTV